MGLYECHGHVLMDGAAYPSARDRHRSGVDDGHVRAVLSALQREGIGYFRDGGDALGVSLRARELAPEYGVELRTPAFAIHKKGRYGSIVGRGWSDMADYRALVREAAAQKADFIKLMFSGIITFRSYGELSCPSLDSDEIRELIRAAHGEGFAVMAHVNGSDAVLAALEAGVDSVEHGYFMDEAALLALARSRTVWVPTLAAVAAFRGREGFPDELVKKTLERQLEAVRYAAGKGAVIAAGSDSGAVGVLHGPGTGMEYALLRSAGLASETIEDGCEELRRRFVPGP